MQKRIYLLLALIVSLFVKSQPQKLYLFSQADTVPLVYAHIAFLQADKMVGGTYCTKQGLVNLPTSDSIDAISISYIGHVTTQFKRVSLNDTLYLPKLVEELKVVDVNGNKSHTYTIGNFKRGKLMSLSAPHGMENVILVEGDSNATYRKLKEFQFYLKTSLNPNRKVQFKVVVYPNDAGKPGKHRIGEKLTESNLFGLSKYKEVSVSLEEMNLIFPKSGLFVGVEWVYSEEDQAKEYEHQPYNGIACNDKRLAKQYTRYTLRSLNWISRSYDVNPIKLSPVFLLVLN